MEGIRTAVVLAFNRIESPEGLCSWGLGKHQTLTAECQCYVGKRKLLIFGAGKGI